MSDIFQIAGMGMSEGKRQLEAISLNAAGASQPGYRRRVPTGRAFDIALAAAAGPSSTSKELRPSASRHVDLRSAAPMATGRPLDLAIEGDDLFFALTDGTTTWLTRAGAFRVNEGGVLVGEQGLRVVGTQGDLHLTGTAVEVAADGSIRQQGVVVASLQLFRANDRVSLQGAQGTLLLAPAGIQAAEAGAGRVRSGALEASNTDTSREMLGITTVSRQFESLSRIVQAYDDVLGRAIQKLGEI